MARTNYTERVVTPQEAAEWMAAEVRAADYLDHAQVIDHLYQHDETLVEHNDAGNPIVSKGVLRAFGKLDVKDIVWSRGGQHWRLREDGDQDGRLVP